MDIRIEYSAGACVFLALLFLALPLDWLLAAVFAAVFHELCHIGAVLITGGKVRSLSIGMGGAVMETTPMEAWQTLFCVLAGPCGSLFLLCLSGFMPKAAVCGLAQGAFNLLPLFPLDGGRALACIAGQLLSPKAAACIISAARYAVFVLILAMGIVGSFLLKLGVLPIFFAVLVLSRSGREKYLAKKSNSEYNRITIYNEVIL